MSVKTAVLSERSVMLADSFRGTSVDGDIHLDRTSHARLVDRGVRVVAMAVAAGAIAAGVLVLALGLLVTLLALGPNDDQEVTYGLSVGLVMVVVALFVVGVGVAGIKVVRRR